MSQVFTWTTSGSKKCKSDLQTIWKKLAVCSESVRWDLEVVLKRPKEQQNRSGEVTKVEDVASLTIVRLHDTGHCCIVPFDNWNPDDVLVGSNAVEDFFVSADLRTRSLWKCWGKRYVVNNFVVSAGMIERGVADLRPVIEILSAPGLNTDDSTLGLWMSEIAKDLIPQECEDSITALSVDKHEFVNQGTAAHRALQWVHAISAKSK